MQRKASYKTIFSGVQQKDLISLNAFTQAVAGDEKYLLESSSAISIRRIEGGSCSSAMLLQEKQDDPPEQPFERPTQQYTPRLGQQENPEVHEVRQFAMEVHKPHGQETLQFVYKEEDSEMSSRGLRGEQLLFARMEQSSIDIKQESGWADDPRLVTMNGLLRSTHITDQRKRIEEEKLRIERQRSELDRKRTEIEAMLKQFYQLRDSSNKDSDTTHQRSDLTIRSVSSNSHDRSCKEQAFGTLNSNLEVTVVQREATKIAKCQAPAELTGAQLQKQKQATKQKKARHALVLQTLWINMIRHHNQLRILRQQMVIGAMNKLHQHWRTTKMALAVKNIAYSSNFKEIGQAFLKLRVAYRDSKKKELPKKNIVIKFAKKQIKERESLQPRPPERICETEASRVQRFSQAVYPDMGGYRDLENQNMKSNNRVAEIDMIIKNQMVRAKQQKVLRQLTNTPVLIDLGFPKSAACSGNVTTRANTRATFTQYQSNSVSKIPVKVSTSRCMPNSHCRQESAGVKKITLWRK